MTATPALTFDEFGQAELVGHWCLSTFDFSTQKRNSDGVWINHMPDWAHEAALRYRKYDPWCTGPNRLTNVTRQARRIAQLGVELGYIERREVDGEMQWVETRRRLVAAS